MGKINWTKISGIFTVCGLVLLSLFSFTSFLRKLPDIRISLLINLLITVAITVAAIFYISGTNYGSSDSDSNKID